MKAKTIVTASVGLMLCTCGPRDVRDGSFLYNRLVWMRMSTLEGPVWITPGLTCLKGPSSSDILIDTGLMSSQQYALLEVDVKMHNSALSKDLISSRCEV